MKILILLLAAAAAALTAQMTPQDIEDVAAKNNPHHECHGKDCHPKPESGVPEPGTWLLIGSGLAAVAWRRRK